MSLFPDPVRARLTEASFWLLCLAALSFPFSVAACNFGLAGSLLTGILAGLYRPGLTTLWQEHRALCIAWLAYLSLFPLGLLWSLDPERGLQIIGRQWFWLAVPLIVQLLQDRTHRRRLMLALSLGLAANLIVCLLQYAGFSLPELHASGGSSATNPTGYIGHTSFGLVYGLWAAMLVHWSLFMHGWPKFTARFLALSSVGMIMLSEGRGGYLVLAALMLVMLWRLLPVAAWMKAVAAALALLLLLAGLSVGPGKARMLDSWHSIQAVEQGNFRNPEARFSMWYTAVVAWRQHAPMGVGTGGFHVASARIMAEHPDLFFGGIPPSHPHNMLLQSLTRWGPLGMLLLAALYVVWIREGWRADWRRAPTVSLVTLTGVALFVQGLTEPSFEEHFPGVLATLLLGTGLAALSHRTDESDPESV